jgi:hypothetical protein
VTQPIPKMRHRRGPPDSNSIALCNQIIQMHMNIRKCRNHDSIKFFKFLRSSNHRVLLGQTMCLFSLREHLRDSFLTLLVPDFLKPSLNQFLRIFRHRKSPPRSLARATDFGERHPISRLERLHHTQTTIKNAVILSEAKNLLFPAVSMKIGEATTPQTAAIRAHAIRA